MPKPSFNCTSPWFKLYWWLDVNANNDYNMGLVQWCLRLLASSVSSSHSADRCALAAKINIAAVISGVT